MKDASWIKFCDMRIGDLFQLGVNHTNVYKKVNQSQYTDITLCDGYIHQISFYDKWVIKL